MPEEQRNSRLLTDTFIRGLKPPEPGQQALYWDSKVPGFGVRVTAGGAKSSSCTPAGRPPMHRLAVSSATPGRWRWLLPARRRGTGSTRSSRGSTLKPKSDDSSRRHCVSGASLSPRSPRTGSTTSCAASSARHMKSEADLRREFIPRWGNRPITDITTLDIRDAIKEVKDRAPRRRLAISWAMPSGCSPGRGATCLRHRAQPGRAAAAEGSDRPAS